MVAAAIFRGDTVQMRALLHAIEHNCTCDPAPDGVVSGTCPAHRAVLEQRFLDGLLFARHLSERLLLEEFRVMFDGSLLRDLLVQAPVVATLLIFIVLDRRDHAKTLQTMRDEITKLQQALIDHMNRLAE